MLVVVGVVCVCCYWFVFGCVVVCVLGVVCLCVVFLVGSSCCCVRVCCCWLRLMVLDRVVLFVSV